MTDSAAHRGTHRLYFLDTIRWFIIVFVVLQHAALIYISYGGVKDFAQQTFSLIVTITDIFMMPILFFLAGYFALASIRKKGPAVFFANKVRRIWIPWIVGVTFIVPLEAFFVYYIRLGGESTDSYWAYWLRWMADAATFHTGRVATADSFSHRHLWFLSVLFAFFVIFTAAYAAEQRFSRRSSELPHREPATPREITWTLVMLGIISAAAFYIVKLFVPWGYQATLLLGLVHFDPSRLGMYAVYFPFGVYAYSRGWFTGGVQPSGLRIWLPLSIALLVLQSYLSIAGIPEVTALTKPFLSLLRSFLGLSMFVSLLILFRQYLNSGTGLDRILSSNSYTVYIIHYPLVPAAAIALMATAVPILVKCMVIFAVSYVISYVLAEFFVKRHPRLSVAALVLVNAMFWVVT